MKKHFLKILLILPFSIFGQLDWNSNSYSTYSRSYPSTSSYDLPVSWSNIRKLSPCEKITNFVKVNGYSTPYNSYESEAIYYVTFYEIIVDFDTYYFAVVCFKTDYLECSEYISNSF